MKASFRALALALALSLAAGGAFAAPKGWKTGTIWNLSMISVEPGQSDAYLESLRGFYTSVMEEAVKQKLILSYRILVGERANPNDFNLVILTESPNWSSLDGMNDRFEALTTKIAGSAEKADTMEKQMMSDRAKIRTIFGGKLMQQVEFIKK